MPCRNDWDPPTKAQAENRRAAKLLIALNNIHGKTSTTQLLVDSTNPVLDTDYVKVLCERMKALGELGRDKLLYSDARDPRARDLATWWEEHQARDEARMRTSPTLNLLGVCSEAMREAGKPYPRTCLVCGLGPCQRGRQLSVGVDLASGPDMTAISVAPRLQGGQPEYLVPTPREPQQVEPVAQIGWADEFGNLFPMGAWKPTQRTHHDSHKTAWRAVFLHPPAAEVQLLRDAVAKLSTIVRVPNAEHIADEHNAAVAFLRRALEGGE